MTEQLTSRGCTPVRTINVSDRFGKYVVHRKRGGEFFAKVVVPQADEARQQYLENRLAQEAAFYHLACTRDLAFVAPDVRLFWQTGYIAEWLEGEPLGGRGRAPAEVVANCIPVMSDIIVSLNSIPVRGASVQKIDWFKHLQESYWLEKALELVDEEDYTEAILAIQHLQDGLTMGWCHGDFTWNHVLVLPDGRYAVTDAEAARSTWPRLYDVAYAYTRLVTLCRSWELGHTFLQDVFTKLDMPLADFRRELWPVLLERSIGVHKDALADLTHADGPRDYRDLAKDLLRKSLDGSMFEALR